MSQNGAKPEYCHVFGSHLRQSYGYTGSEYSSGGDHHLSRKPTRGQPRQKSVGRPESTRPSTEMAPPASTSTHTTSESPHERDGRSLRGRLTTILAVGGLLALHYALAASSLLKENPTVDEVVHMPAGITYWQKRTFRLYHHNPPLVKLVAALPVVWANPIMKPAYAQSSWQSADPSPATFAHTFAFLNADRYFELFRLGALLDAGPSSRSWGGWPSSPGHGGYTELWGGLLSLVLWDFLPEHPGPRPACHVGDMGATALGVAATYVFWALHLHQAQLARWATAAGIMLGLCTD